MELDCPVKQYHWGKHGVKSLVAELKQNANPDYYVSNGDTYAELWMGTYPSGPSYVKKCGVSLESWISQNSSSLGKNVKSTYGSSLPFLFKVLSIEIPLSIQVHPTKDMAEKLHAKYPDLYKDRNHKPELAIALTEFEALCGFRPMSEIKKFFCVVPEIQEIIGAELSEILLKSNEVSQNYALKKCFTSLMLAPEQLIKTKLKALVERVSKMDEEGEERSAILAPLLEKIYRFFPGDVGCFCIYFFNYLVLKPDEAIFLRANEPHAYLSGDCIECMACSDNVVRAGLTPKYRDVKTLCEIVNYSCNPAKSKILTPEVENEHSVIYRPPVNEFAVCKLNIKKSDDIRLCRNTASISIVIDGHARIEDIEATKGKVIFNPANEILNVKVPAKKSLLLFQAFVNV